MYHVLLRNRSTTFMDHSRYTTERQAVDHAYRRLARETGTAPESLRIMWHVRRAWADAPLAKEEDIRERLAFATTSLANAEAMSVHYLRQANLWRREIARLRLAQLEGATK